MLLLDHPSAAASPATYEIPAAVLRLIAGDAGCELVGDRPATGRPGGGVAFVYGPRRLARARAFWHHAGLNLHRPAGDPDAQLLGAFCRDARGERTDAGGLALVFERCRAS